MRGMRRMYKKQSLRDALIIGIIDLMSRLLIGHLRAFAAEAAMVELRSSIQGHPLKGRRHGATIPDRSEVDQQDHVPRMPLPLQDNVMRQERDLDLQRPISALRNGTGLPARVPANEPQQLLFSCGR
jgi:hypothetical protein